MIEKIGDAKPLVQKASGFLIASVISIICLAMCGAYAHADTLDTNANASTVAVEDPATFAEKAGVLDQGTNDLVTQDQTAGDQTENQPVGDLTGDQATSDSTGNKTDVSDQATTPVNKPERPGWMQDVDGSWYYFANVDAVPSTGWIKLKGVWYYLDPADNGKMKTGKFNDGNANYISAASGAMYAKKWVKLDSDWYYASASGALKSGWQKSGSKWYWLQGDQQGLMATNAWITDNNKRYYLDEKGVMKTGWFQIGDDWYYANKSGDLKMNGWVKSKSKWYWLAADQEGKMATNTWITDQGKRYYLDASGVMGTKWIQIGSDWYYANKSGAQQMSGWIKSGGKWYWLQGDKQGLMIADALQTIAGKQYSFDGSGAMRANVAVDLGNDKVGYATSSGAIVTVGTKEDGKLILRDAQGNALTGWQKIGGAWFYGDEGGVAHTGWLELGGKKYWLDDNGVMATGVRTIDGQRYVFGPSGAYTRVSAAHAATFERAIKELEKCTNSSMTKEQKLRAAFDHIRDDFREYNPRIPHMKSVGWETVYADDIFVRRGGNCLSCAAAMAFMAKAAGYENVYACNSGGHGWAEIDGLVYDPEWARHNAGNYFARPYSQSGGPSYASAISSGQAWMRVAI